MNEHSGMLGAYGRDTQKKFGECLLAFAFDHHLALVSIVFSPLQNGMSHTFDGVGSRLRIDYHGTTTQDTRAEHCCLSSAIMAHVKLLGCFASNRLVSRNTKPPSTVED